MEHIKTPYFEIDKKILDQYYDMLEDSLKLNWRNYTIGYSFKTNSLPWLVKYLKSRGAYAEVVSNDEYLLAKYLGYKDDEIIYNGPYKEQESFCNILDANGYVNLDSVQEIAWLEAYAAQNSNKLFRVGIRINFNLEAYCPQETTMGDESGRFGFCYETGKFAEAVERIQHIENVIVSGIHLHSSSKTRSVKVFETLAKMACKIKREFGLSLEYIDFGGGYCGGLAGKPEYPDYFPVIARQLKEEYNQTETRMIVEPGISLISKCSRFISKIFDVRDIKGTRYIMTDGSRFNLDPTMIKSSYIFFVEKDNDNKRDVLSKQVVSGFSCMEADRMFEIYDSEELCVGDKIVYENVGGYTMCLNPLFIQYFPAVYLKENDSLTLIRRKWTPREYVQGSVIDDETV